VSEFARNPDRRSYSLFVLTLVIATLGACGHGPPEYSASLADYDTPTGGQVTVALRSFIVVRRARGISAYPDGGMAMVVDGGVEVNICEQQTGTFRQIVVLHEHEHAGVTAPIIRQWLDTAVRISRYSGGDTVVRLPSGVHTGVSIRDSLRRMHEVTLPECKKSLTALRASTLMPDGRPQTP
jgi:hypothetical protein